MAEGFTVKHPYPECGNISMNYGGIVEIDNCVNDTIVLTAVYNLEYLSKMVKELRAKFGADSRIQLRFANSPAADGYLLLFMKVWNETTNIMYPEESNRYIVLAPVAKGIKKKGFKVWTEWKPVIETVIVDKTPVTSICPNHVEMGSEDEILAKLEGAV